MMSSRWWNIQSIHNITLRNCPQFVDSFFSLCPSSPLRDSASLRCSFIFNSAIDLITELILLFLFLVTLSFQAFHFLCPNLCFGHISVIKLKMNRYFSWNSQMSHFQHSICFPYSIMNTFFHTNFWMILKLSETIEVSAIADQAIPFECLK